MIRLQVLFPGEYYSWPIGLLILSVAVAATHLLPCFTDINGMAVLNPFQRNLRLRLVKALREDHVTSAALFREHFAVAPDMLSVVAPDRFGPRCSSGSESRR